MQLAHCGRAVYAVAMPTPDDYQAYARCYAYAAHRLERRLSTLYDAALAPLGLTLRQFAILAEASFSPRLPLARLAGRLVVDPTTLTRALKPLIARKWITLSPDANDARQRLVEVTLAGLAVLEAAGPPWTQAQSEVAAVLGAQNADALASTLKDAELRLRAARR